MAARVETAEQEKTNTIDPKRLKTELARIEDAIEAKESHRMGYVESCKPFNERISNAYEIASKAAGVPTKVLKAKIRERALYQSIKRISDDMEDEVRETFEMVTQALGGLIDLPLGAAAAKMDKGDTEAGKKPRGGRKAPSPSAAPAPAGISAEAAAETEHPTFLQGFDARMADEGCSIPGDLKGDERDRWHAGWLKAGDQLSADRNAALLQGENGIKSLPH